METTILWHYCGLKESCASWWMVYPAMILLRAMFHTYQCFRTGGGFLPSTVLSIHFTAYLILTPTRLLCKTILGGSSHFKYANITGYHQCFDYGCVWKWGIAPLVMAIWYGKPTLFWWKFGAADQSHDPPSNGLLGHSRGKVINGAFKWGSHQTKWAIFQQVTFDYRGLFLFLVQYWPSEHLIFFYVYKSIHHGGQGIYSVLYLVDISYIILLWLNSPCIFGS